MTARTVNIPDRPLVVGSVATMSQLTSLQPAELSECCDILEIRLDGMSQDTDNLDAALDRLDGFPLLFTARGPDEGGIVDLSAEERSSLLLSIADRATWIDVELSAFGEMEGAISQLRQKGVGLILSYHNFDKTPLEADMQSIVDLAVKADIVKLAVRHHEVADLTTCAGILKGNDHPMSMMGMGALAPVSRLLYAQHGSLLNYGYLGDEPTAPGQWPAKLLKEAIAKLDAI